MVDQRGITRKWTDKNGLIADIQARTQASQTGVTFLFLFIFICLHISCHHTYAGHIIEGLILIKHNMQLMSGHITNIRIYTEFNIIYCAESNNKLATY